MSNLDVEQVRAARAAPGTVRLACTQVLYHLRDRGIEKDVLRHCEHERIAVVGYTPLARGRFTLTPQDLSAIDAEHRR